MISSARMSRFAAIVLGILAASAASGLAETVTLQQGADNYQGASDATLWGQKAAQPNAAPKDALCLRGTENRVLLRFELPRELAAKKLARAQVEVFVPTAKNLKMICEIIARSCPQGWSAREANWDNRTAAEKWDVPGAVANVKTSTSVARVAEAMDSYSFWEYSGQFFPHRYRQLGLPEGGKWISFNITKAAAEWFADAGRNNGIILQPISQADGRFPNNVIIDIPTSSSSDTQHRPRLVLDLEPLAKPFLVGATHTLDRISDSDTRFRYNGPWEEKHELAMARNEVEGFQLLVYPIAGDLKGVSLQMSDLTGPGGAKIDKQDVQFYCQEQFLLHPNGKIQDWYFHGKNFVVPDPLSTGRPIDLPAHQATAFWVNVRTRPDTKGGLYKGKVTVVGEGIKSRDLELSVKVWDYKIPEKWNFQTMGQTVWESLNKAYGRVSPEMKRKYIDFLMDHRFNPTEQYADTLSPSPADMAHVQQRGGNTIYLSGAYKGGIKTLKERYEQVKKMGLIDDALVYIGDETSKWDQMRAASDAIRRECPELMIMIGGSFPRKELDGVIDIFDPQIDLHSNAVYSLPAEQMAPLIAKSQARGERFFWYVAAGPMLPCPNVQIEDPLIASRVLFWMTWKFGVTGFEYYCYDLGWEYQPKAAAPWPKTPFSPRAFKGNYNGDGNLFYPGPDGPFSSVRLENIRDGIEDWESHFVLRDCVEAAEARLKNLSPSITILQPLLAKARELLKVPDEVCKFSFSEWTWEPAVLLKARAELGETIDQLSSLVSEQEIVAVREARKKAQLDRQHKMLARRAAAAATQPAKP